MTCPLVSASELAENPAPTAPSAFPNVAIEYRLGRNSWRPPLFSSHDTQDSNDEYSSDVACIHARPIFNHLGTLTRVSGFHGGTQSDE
jgi:hypothetical protein